MTALPARQSGRWARLRRDLGREETRWAFLFLLPWIIGFVIFTGRSDDREPRDLVHEHGPRAAGSTWSARELPATGCRPARRLALQNTIFFAVLHVPLAMGSDSSRDMLLRVGRAAGFFRTVFYLPTVTPTVAVGALFLFLLNGQVGLVNRALGLFGIDGPNWTTDPNWIKPGIVLMSLWALGSTVVIYFAALRNVPLELYEAARVDGAGAWQQFRNITVPMISGALFFTLIVNTIAALQMFDQVYAMYFGNQPSTAGDRQGLFYVVYLFDEAFKNFRLGYASALAWVLFIVIMVITVIQLRLSKRWVYYENE